MTANERTPKSKMTNSTEEIATAGIETEALLGRVDRCEGTKIIGWAASSDRLDRRLKLELLLDGAPVTHAIADQLRPDLVAAGIGDGRFGFEIAVPARYCDNMPHELVVREVSTGRAIAESPVEFLAAPIVGSEPNLAQRLNGEESATSRRVSHIIGFVDEYKPTGVVGWAARRQGSQASVAVELLIDGIPSARTTADLQRADLADIGMRSDRHGFRLRLPDSIFDNKPHLLEVREISTQETLHSGTCVLCLNACDRWAAGDPDLRARWTQAEVALSFCEGASDDVLGKGIHRVLLQMQEWLRNQPQVRSRRRVQNLLNRLTMLRCRLELHGLIDSRQIGGNIVDLWSNDEPLELELLVSDNSVHRSCAVARTRPDGSFTFVIPDDLLDNEIHKFHLGVGALGANLGPWSFLLSSDGSNDRRGAAVGASDPVWETVPARLGTRSGGELEIQLTPLEVAKLALQDALDADPTEESGTESVVELRCRVGNLLIEAGDYSGAMDQFDSAAKLDPNSAHSVVGEITCLLARGDQSAAQARLHDALSRFPDTRELHRLSDEISGSRRMKKVRLVAFYLPQFHPIPENDQWWGKGFTEWSNVAAATPLFEGHLQPRRPTHLGFYDLRLAEAANAQFNLARQYGIEGFCYYYYWFNGRRILQRPLQDLASGRTGPFPFCICWANEPWTRSWDGVTGDVLIAQNHTPESDLEFIKDLAPLLQHKDYIRVEGKPIVMVYRAESLATPRETVAAWREWCRGEGIGELHLCAVQAFHFHDPRPFGFDAAVEFPPHCPATVYPDYDYHQVMEVKGRVEGFHAKIFSYQTFANGDMKVPREPFTLHRTAMVAWDNTARRQKAAHVFHDFSVSTFERWVLANAQRAAIEQTDGLCFVNAWNEWAEGSVMEPDAHFGYEILEATRRAIRHANFDSRGTYWRTGHPSFPEDRLMLPERIILVGHDAFRSGAQTNLLNMARTLKRTLGMDVIVMLIEGGALLEDYERVCPTFVVGREEGWRERVRKQLQHYRFLGAGKAICNTCVTGEFTEVFKQEGYRVVSLIHELPALIESYNLGGQCWTLAAHADSVVFASRLVADEFCSRYWPDMEKVAIAPQGIRFNRYHAERDTVRLEIREELGLPAKSLLIVGCGHGDTRKGIDLFVQMAADVRRECEPDTVGFVWIGPVEWTLSPYILSDIQRLDLNGVVRITGQTTDPGRYFMAGDIFALTSREDPFPSVVLEAFDAKLPVIAFAGGGGYVDIVNKMTGELVPYLDVSSMSNAILSYIRNPDRRLSVGVYNHTLCRQRFGYEPYMRKLLALLSDVPPDQVMAGLLKRQSWFNPKARPTISVIVPNYNYARHLELRLRTVIEQTLPPDEIIILDDASTDSSLEVIREIIKRSPITIKVTTNPENSGNPFVQWARGLADAKGELIWIAEADDYCEPTFLETLAKRFTDEKVVLAWSDSIMVDESGASRGMQYKDYYSKNYGGRWYLNFRMEGRRLVDDCLFAENIIPNASAVLFRRNAVNKADLNLMQQYLFSGDWWFWLSLALVGDVAYCASPLNYHRRHARSVMGEVLRSGDSLLRETMNFYSRITAHKPQSLSHGATVLALTRLQQTFKMFPALLASAPRITEHPAYAAQFRELTQAFARATHAQARESINEVVLVMSQDVISDDSSGTLLLRHLVATKSLVNLILLASEKIATEFAARTKLPNVAITVISPDKGSVPIADSNDVSASEHLLHAALRDLPSGNLVTHGLLAHCLVGTAPPVAEREWQMVGAKEFDQLLGFPPKDRGVTIAGIRSAIERCSVVKHLGQNLPHALARLAQTSCRAIDALQVDMILMPPCEPKGEVPTIRFVGIGPHASLTEWQQVARALRSLQVLPRCDYHLRLLAWGPGFQELGKVASEGLTVEVINIFERPSGLGQLGDVLLAPDSTLQIHGAELGFELQGTRMRPFGFASVMSESDSEPRTELLYYIASLATTPATKLPGQNQPRILTSVERPS